MARKPHPAAKKSGNGHAPAPGLGARVRSLNRAAHTFQTQVRTTAADLGNAFDVRRRVRRHPYVMVAAALGVGYVLGGGLFSRQPDRVIAVVKAFSTCVGEGPFVTRMDDADASALRELAQRNPHLRLQLESSV